MKYVLFIGDGMADFPLDALGGKTPLQASRAPGMARLAGGRLFRVRTCPQGLPPGSDVAFLTLMGHDPLACYTGRSPLEAAGEGVALGDGEVSLRVNLITVGDGGEMESYNGSGIGGADAAALMGRLLGDAEFASLMRRAGMRVAVTDTFRHIAALPAGDAPFALTPAHDIAGQKLADHRPAGQAAELLTALQDRAAAVLARDPVNRGRVRRGERPANGIWFWGAGRATRLRDFQDAYGLTGAAITAVPLVRGIARLSGLCAPRVPGATGELETNYAGKAEAGLAALREGRDLALFHLEAPDDLSHLGDLPGKLEAIERFDSRIVRPVLDALDQSGQPYRALVMPDHYTLLSTRTHDATPVPCAIYDSRSPGAPRPFTERACEDAPVIERGGDLIDRLIGP
ncbi:MAG: phosphoglycerate mutase [Clostridiales bacterium]|nr:phosphoglycerate mutase [Clostridiales bacterium]